MLVHPLVPAMDDSYASDFGSDYESLPETSQTPKPAFSGIKLVLPSLSSVKSKGKQKKKNGKDRVKGPPRPLKLKPLKEVLTGLMVRMKKCATNPPYLSLISDLWPL